MKVGPMPDLSEMLQEKTHVRGRSFKDTHDLARQLLELPVMQIDIGEGKGDGTWHPDAFDIVTKLRSAGRYKRGYVYDTHVCFWDKMQSGADKHTELADIKQGVVLNMKEWKDL